jgi:pimeloyl-ACP methyl ester carboxylesterase
MVQAIKRDEVFIEPEGIHVETQQPERRSRKPPLLLVHGALTGSWLWSSFAGHFAERGWEAHALNLRGHFTSDVADLGSTTMDDYATDIGIAMRHLARPAVIIGWGIGALAALRYAERHPVLALVLLAPSPPAGALPREPNEHELNDVPDVYDADWWGWVAPIEKLRTWLPDMNDFELEKMQEMIAGAHESGRARRERMRGVQVDPTRINAPTLVIGAGLDDVVHPAEAQRTADLLGAAYEYFPSASHFGLVMGTGTWPQVAGSVLGWLEERRHAMTAQSNLLAGAAGGGVRR